MMRLTQCCEMVAVVAVMMMMMMTMTMMIALTEVKIVKQMPAQAPGKKPTVAVITSRYYEKLAVDAMMEDKTTFVKYKTEGAHTTCGTTVPNIIALLLLLNGKVKVKM